jgi:ribosome-binding protein aMBF1 (putative translation factor)
MAGDIPDRCGCHFDTGRFLKEEQDNAYSGNSGMQAASSTVRRDEFMKKLKGGWVEGSVKELMDLDSADMEYIETRLALTRAIREERKKQHITQVTLAARMKTTQSRVAKIEKGDPTISMDMILRGFFTLGLTRKELAKAM